MIAPSGSMPVAVAVLDTEPASTSACVSVYVAVPVTVSPGASVPSASGQPVRVTTPPTFGSFRTTSWRVLLPLLVTLNE